MTAVTAAKRQARHGGTRMLVLGFAMSVLGFGAVTAALSGPESAAQEPRWSAGLSPRGLPWSTGDSGAAWVALSEADAARTYLVQRAAMVHRRVWANVPSTAGRTAAPACDDTAQRTMSGQRLQAPISSVGPVR